MDNQPFLLWFGAATDPSGYGEVTRNYLRCLEPITDFEIKLQNRSFWHGDKLDISDNLELVTRLAKRQLPTELDRIVALFNLTPENWFVQSGVKQFVGMTTFETDGIPSGWLMPMRSMDHIITYTQFNKDTFTQSGVTRPIHIVPHGVDVDRFTPENPQILSIMNAIGGRFAFGSNFDWTERKNPKALLTAYYRAFTKKDDVVLVLKVYHQHPIHESVENVKKNIAEVKKACGMDPSNLPPIILINDIVSSKDMPLFYSSINAYVLPSRGEGWSLCVDPNTNIETIDGIKKMKDVDDSDCVRTRDGFQRVLGKSTRHVEYAYSVKTVGNEPVIVTEEHPFYAFKRSHKKFNGVKVQNESWLNVTNLMKGDFIGVPIVKYRFRDIPYVIDLSRECSVCHDLDYIWSESGYSSTSTKHSYSNMAIKYGCSRRQLERAARHISGDFKSKHASVLELADKMIRDGYKRPDPIKTKRFIEIDDRLAEIIGWYIAEGNTEPSGRIVLNLGSGDDHYINDLVENIRDIFSTEPHFEIDGNKRRIRWSCKPFAKWLDRNCGKGAWEKRIPVSHDSLVEQLFTKSGIFSLFRGVYRGDGYAKGGIYEYTTVSDQLVYDIRNILLFFGIYTLNYYSKGRSCWSSRITGFDYNMFCGYLSEDELLVPEKKSGRYVIFAGDFCWIPIKSISKIEFNDCVMDICVENSHEFVGNGLLLHNTHSEAMATGLPTIGTNWSGNTEFMTNENSYLVDYELEKIKDEEVKAIPHYAKQSWASIDVEGLSDAMRQIYDNQDEAKAKGALAREDMVNKWTWKLAAEKLNAVLHEIY